MLARQEGQGRRQQTAGGWQHSASLQGPNGWSSPRLPGIQLLTVAILSSHMEFQTNRGLSSLHGLQRPHGDSRKWQVRRPVLEWLLCKLCDQQVPHCDNFRSKMLDRGQSVLCLCSSVTVQTNILRQTDLTCNREHAAWSNTGHAS